MLTNALLLGAIPAFSMLVSTYIGLGLEVDKNVAGALQHFAAGILICSISTELLPVMADAKGFTEVFFSGVGFFSGVALMILVGILFPEIEDDDDKSEVQAPSPRRTPSTIQIRRSVLKELYKDSSDLVSPEPTPMEESPLIQTREPLRAFPAKLLLTVCVDSILDGLLIGIATAAGPSAGPMLAISLCVEMSFLGLTLATSMAGQPPKLSVPAAFCGPLCILGGATCGGLLSSALTNNPLFLIGLLSFGVSALLFMVAEELLLEAHEKGDHVWWVDLQLYIGFFVSILLGKLVPEE